MECVSYLGVVTVALVFYAAANAARFPRAGFWWLACATMVLLGCGASWQIGSLTAWLPMSWLQRNVFLFKTVRVAARFNLLVGVAAALIAAAGLRHLLARLPQRRARGAVVGLLFLLALADLANVPFWTRQTPAMPSSYAFVSGRNPRATILEIPQHISGGSFLSSTCGYWQSIHRLRTSAGYSGQGNFPFDNMLTWNSPFLFQLLARPDYLSDPDHFLATGPTPIGMPSCLDLSQDASFDDFAWLYATYHGYDYIILHQWEHGVGSLPGVRRLKERLAGAKVYEDKATVVYDRALLSPPKRPVLAFGPGWRTAAKGRLMRVAGRSSELAVYNPDPDRDLVLRIGARSIREGRSATLKSGDSVLARWEFSPGEAPQAATSPPFRLSAGLHRLTLECDAEILPADESQAAFPWDHRPYSLRVSSIVLAPGIDDAGREAAVAERLRPMGR